MFIIDVSVVNRKAFAEFYEKYRGLISSVQFADLGNTRRDIARANTI